MMTLEVIILWLLSVTVPIATLVYVIMRFRLNDTKTGNVFAELQRELEECRARELLLNERVGELEKLKDDAGS